MKILITLLVIVLLILLWKREEIAENKFTKAKLELLKAFLDSDYDKAKTVLDSLK